MLNNHLHAVMPTHTQASTSATMLPVMEQFYTIQGEGFHQGKAAYFIRLGGCTVGCHWCDVKASWDAAAHPQHTISELTESALVFPARLAVITGGEPLIYNLDQLCTQLHTTGFRTHLETSGAYPLSGQWDWICLSPKKFKAPLPDVTTQADELKIIVYNRHDFVWAEQYAAMVSPKCRLYLQPEWSKRKQMMPLIVEYVKQHPQWQVTLQTHKYMQIP